jgi:hypothetical protein
MYGASPRTVDQHIVYLVEVVEGRFAGRAVETAVAIAELGRWPLVPPHWVYLPETVTFPVTNKQPCTIPGWVGHSRQIVAWGSDRDPTGGWLAHVRGVVGEAT